MQCDRTELPELGTKPKQPPTEFAVDGKARRALELMPPQDVVRSASGQRKNAIETAHWLEPRSEISAATNYQILNSF